MYIHISNLIHLPNLGLLISLESSLKLRMDYFTHLG
jgi:hypothetical protein